jgi:hypothetical protein
VTAKSSKSGILFRSVGQCVGSPVDRYLRWSCLMAVKRLRPFGVINLDPQVVCLAFQSPAIRKWEPRVRKKSSYSSGDMACLGGLFIAPICNGHGNAFIWTVVLCILVVVYGSKA